MMHKNKRKTLIILRVFSALAFCFFLFMVGRFIDQSFWRDEAVTALTAQKSPSEIIQIMIKDNNPPLFRLILSGIARVFGSSEIALRSLSVLSVIGTGAILRKIIRNKIGKELATISFFMMPLTYIYGTEARAYTFFMFLCALSYLAMLRLHKEKSWQNYLFFITANTLMLYGFTTSLFVFAGIMLALLYLEKGLKNWKILLPTLIPVILFSPWIFVIIKQATLLGESNYWLSFHPVISALQVILGLYTSIVFYYPPDKGFYTQTSTLFGGAAILCTTITLFILTLKQLVGLIKKKDQQVSQVILLLTPLVIAYLISFVQPTLNIRYLLIAPISVLAILFSRLPRSAYNAQYLATIAFTLLSATVALIKYPQASIKPGYRALASQLEGLKTEDTLIVSDNELTHFSCRWYLGDCYILKDYDTIDKSIGLALLSPEQAITEEDASEYTKIALLYWNRSETRDFKFLEEYALEESGQDPNSGISFELYSKLDKPSPQNSRK